jgi:uncharacterized protein (DUF58 family)
VSTAPTRPGTEALLRRLELTVTRRLDGMLQGDHAGLRPGPGSEAGEARAYVAGDDVRRMDWAVTARTGTAHVRLPIADHELETWVVVDRSPSLDFGTASCEKRDLALSSVAAVGHLTARAGNRLGAVLVGGGGNVTRVPARTGRVGLHALLHTVASTPRADGGGATDLGPPLRELARTAHRRSLVVVVSDFLGPTTWTAPMRVLATRHDVLAVEVLDPRELELPDVGVLALVDPETGSRMEVSTSDRKLRTRYAEAAAAQRAAVAAGLRAAPADHLQLRTDRDWLGDVVRFVQRRRLNRRPPPTRTGG